MISYVWFVCSIKFVVKQLVIERVQLGVFDKIMIVHVQWRASMKSLDNQDYDSTLLIFKNNKVQMRSVIAFALFAGALALTCTGSINNVPFDLSPLRNDMADYRTDLYNPDPTHNRTYALFYVKWRTSLIYNFCRNTLEIPLDYEGGDKCKETLHKVEGGQAIPTDKPSPAFLLQKIGNYESTCTRLALDYNDESNSRWAFFDTTDPAMGVVLQYLEGDYCCPYGGTCANSEYRQKTITFSLRCADAVATVPTEAYIETNNNKCDYTVYYRSVYACPTGINIRAFSCCRLSPREYQRVR